MLSAGNDIIALNLIDRQRSSNSRFYAKILSVAEMNLFRSAEMDLAMEHFVWLCWSVKESVYKYLKRNDHGLVFSPTKISIRQIAETTLPAFANTVREGFAAQGKYYCGNVKAGNTHIYFRSTIEDDLIATIAGGDEDLKNTFWGVRSISNESLVEQSQSVRSFFLNRMQCFYPGKQLHVQKNDAGYPQLFDGPHQIPLPVSFAHHGKFVSYSFSLA